MQLSQVYKDVKEVINPGSEGRVTVLHFPNYDDMDAEVICGALEEFSSLPSRHPKYLVIDNMDAIIHPCNSKLVQIVYTELIFILFIKLFQIDINQYNQYKIK